MNTLYDRRETDAQIEFEFHHMPVANVLFLLLLTASLAPGGGRCTGKIRPVCAILLILWVIGLLPAWIELEKAMRAGSVLVSGSKISTTNPLKVIISKK
jgi:hypothetical protein